MNKEDPDLPVGSNAYVFDPESFEVRFGIVRAVQTVTPSDNRRSPGVIYPPGTQLYLINIFSNEPGESGEKTYPKRLVFGNDMQAGFERSKQLAMRPRSVEPEEAEANGATMPHANRLAYH